MTPISARPIDTSLAAKLDKAVAEYTLDEGPPVTRGAADRVTPTNAVKRRKGFDPQDYSGLSTLTLVRDDDGFLRWVYQSPALGPATRRARGAASRAVGTEIVREVSFKETPANEVIAALERLDVKLTPERGLRRLKGNKFVNARGFKTTGRVLLMVHGTFSKSDMFADELTATAAGQAFLGKAGEKYDAILAFDHPTISVSPWINAIDLEDELAGVTGPIDVACHSRGGLVVAWWLHNAKRQADNVVFVGTPLEGTSLASPASLRGALQGLANIFRGLETAGALASTILPFMGAVTGLATILGGVLQLGASTPFADAVVVTVPGLAGQSRVQNNAELDRLHRARWVSTPAFHAVVSNFKPLESDAAWWQVWKLFHNPVDKVLSLGAEAIFKEKNDLVVNTQSMTNIFRTAMQASQFHDFGDSPTVHHCNYFRQDETIRFLRRALKV